MSYRCHPWTAAELQRLRRLYPVLTTAELVTAFYPHTRRSIQATAQTLQLRSRRMINWMQHAAKHKPVFSFVSWHSNFTLTQPSD